jgi:hypothetical protein
MSASKSPGAVRSPALHGGIQADEVSLAHAARRLRRRTTRERFRGSGRSQLRLSDWV